MVVLREAAAVAAVVRPVRMENRSPGQWRFVVGFGNMCFFNGVDYVVYRLSINAVEYWSSELIEDEGSRDEKNFG